ncbi:MAG: hypothetical protein ACRDJF_09080, partial [Actinomycetota bacterium]
MMAPAGVTPPVVAMILERCVASTGGPAMHELAAASVLSSSPRTRPERSGACTLVPGGGPRISSRREGSNWRSSRRLCSG